MADYFHLALSHFSRGRGQNAVRAAAYRSASRLVDRRTGEVFDYRAKDDVRASLILAPPAVQDLAGDREGLWNAVEAACRRSDARVAREILVALPGELDAAEALAVVRGYVEAVLVSRGAVADVNLHDPEPRYGARNPHAHILWCGRQALERSADPGGGVRFGRVLPELDGLGALYRFRADWADQVNTALAERGVERRVSHRSFRRDQLPLEPRRRRRAEHLPAAERNLERAILDPDAAVAVFGARRLLFTRAELAAWLGRFDLDPRRVNDALAAAFAAPGIEEIGRGADRRIRHASRRALLDFTRLEAGTRERLAAAEAGEGGARLRIRARASGLGQGPGQGEGEGDLEALRQAAAAAGRSVLAFAPSPQRALALGGGGAWVSASEALDRLAALKARGRPSPDVVVVAAAQLLSVRELASLLEGLSGAPTRLILSGDPDPAAGPVGIGFRRAVEIASARTRDLGLGPQGSERGETSDPDALVRAARRLARLAGLEPTRREPERDLVKAETLLELRRRHMARCLAAYARALEGRDGPGGEARLRAETERLGRLEPLFERVRADAAGPKLEARALAGGIERGDALRRRTDAHPGGPPPQPRRPREADLGV